MNIEYKKSPVGKIPIDWLCNILGNIATVKGGKRMPKGIPFSENKTQYPYIRVSDFINGTVSTDNLKYVLEKDREKIKRYTISKNDLYISIAGSIGIVGSVPEILDGAQLTENAAKVVFKNSLKTTKNYYKYFLQSDECQSQFLQETGTGGGVPKLALFRIENTYIPYPPLPEQKKIAKILTSVDEVIEATETQINKLKDLKKGTMNELLTKGIGHTEFKDSAVGRIPVEWSVVKTGDIATSIVPGRNKPKVFDGNIPWITISDIDSLFVSKSKIGLGVSREVLKDAQGKTVPEDSVIMTVVGEFGISAVSKKEIVINQQLHAFVCSNKISPLYLCFVLVLLKKQIENLSTQTTIAYLNKDNSESILIPLPPLPEQQKITSILTSIDNNIEQKQTKLTQTKNLKKSLMADLLTGRVRVNVD